MEPEIAKKTAIAVTSVKADLCLCFLFDENTTEAATTRILSALGSLVDLGYFTRIEREMVVEILSRPVRALLRRDKGLWVPTVFFLRPGNSVFSISVEGEKVKIIKSNKDGTYSYSGTAGSPFEEGLLAELDTSLSNEQGAGIGTDSCFALFVARGYDTLQRVAQLRQAREMFGEAFSPAVVINEAGNLLPADIIFPFAKSIQRVSASQDWRLKQPLSLNICECLKYEKKVENRFHTEIVALIRSFSVAAYELPADIPKGRFSIFISFEAEKRQMVNQQDFFAEVLRKLSEEFGPLSILVNGMTGSIEGVDQFEDIRAFETNIIENLKSVVPSAHFTHMHNWTFIQKAIACSNLDFFVAPLGTAALIPQVLGVHGVVYNSADMIRQIRWFLQVMPSNAKLIDTAWVSQVADDLALRKYNWGWADNTRHSYKIDIGPAKDFCITVAKMSQEHSS